MQNIKRTTCLALAALLLGLTACRTAAPAPSADSPAASPDGVLAQTNAIAFTDALGRAVTVPVQPQRVAALIGSFADVWCLAGGQSSLVAAADDTWTSFSLDLDKDVVNLGAIKEPSVEKLLAAAPELVIASANTAADVDLLATLEQAGLNVVYFNVTSFADYLDMLDLCTSITGSRENYESYGVAVQRQVDDARAMAGGESPTVLYLRATGSSVKVKNSQGSVLGEMLADLGCTNIADSDDGLLEQLSLEAILAADPDKIFIVAQGADPIKAEAMLQSEVLANPAWQQLTAVQTGQVYMMDQALYNLKPNEKWGEAYENLAQILYGKGA